MKRIALAVLLLAIMAFGSIGTTFAQGNAVENYEFSTPATWLDTPYVAKVGATAGIRVRAIPTEHGNVELFSVPANTVVEVVAEVTNNDGDDWVLIRAWNGNTYLGSGWMQVSASRLNRNNPPTLPTSLPTCSLTDRGEPMEVNIRFNEGWTHDANSTACTLFYEGRVEETEFHNYWIIRDSNAQATATVTTTDYLENGFMWLLEGGAWIHPTTWSMGRGFANGDTGQTLRFPPMVSYFAMDKQGVMAREGYRWPFIVHMIDGTALNFAYGDFGTATNTVDRCELDQPREMSVTGIYNSANASFRSTSVGAEGCATIIYWQLPDGTHQLFGLNGTDENLEYKFVYAAYLIPSDWDSAEIGEFVMDEIVASARVGTEIEVVGIDGLSNFTR